MARERLTGILLVGGASRRFGSPKALARIGEETLAERAWRILGETCDDRVAVGKESDGLALPFPVLDDEAEVRAPLAGLVAGLRAASTDLALVLPVDVPLVPASALRALAAACADAAVPQTGPLPGAYRKTALRVLERRLQRRELTLRDALVDLDTRVVELDPWGLENVNTPADLHAARRRERALAAAREVARAHGVDAPFARILQDWNDTIVHLAPAPLVARVATSEIRAEAGRDAAAAVLAREVAVVAHAAAHGAPVVPSSVEPPPGPHRAAGTVVTLWPYVKTAGGEPSPRAAGAALRALHDGLGDYRGPLPALTARLDRAAAIVRDSAALPALPRNDCEFLAGAFARLRRRALEAATGERVLHGGPHTSNLLLTADGPRWIDLDTVCRGPVEWDLAHLPEDAATAFPEADTAGLAAMRLLVSAEVAIWCWRAHGRAPEVDEAARFHLARLRGDSVSVAL